MQRPDGYQGMDELLQADVMRFMAIIAFCLIAILALVQAAEPADVPAARVEPPPRPAEPVPALEPRLVLQPDAARQPLRPKEPEEVVPPAPPQAADAAVPAQTEGLSLRFASDRDFLRLLNRSEIRVFAFDERGVLAVDPDLRLRPAQPPGELHELLPETIPQVMREVLGEPGRSASLRWGVAFPERIARAIRSHVGEGANGTLVIDRYGEVRLHGA